MDVETRLAKAFRSRTELRDPHANYNKMSMEELKKNYPTDVYKRQVFHAQIVPFVYFRITSFESVFLLL